MTVVAAPVYSMYESARYESDPPRQSASYAHFSRYRTVAPLMVRLTT